jgi:deoxyguanosine kinase
MSKDIMNMAFLSLGGNIGTRLENLNKAIYAIKAIGIDVVKASSIYETQAWGSSSKKKYLNQVIKISTHLDAQELLKQLLAIEKEIGRKRTANRYADRTMDIDILFFNASIVASKNLSVPHPRLHLRKFILIPFYEIEKKFVHPILKKSIATLLSACEDKLDVVIYKEPNLIKYICIEGNIGSGKSTLARFLAKQLGANYLPEIFEENQLLPLFYTRPKLYAFALENSFLISRFQQLNSYFKIQKKMVVSDFSIYKCLWFAKANLSGKDYVFFKKQFEALLNHLPKPDLIIHLETSIANLKQNIKKRGRSYEQNISEAYLIKLEKQYEKGLKKIKNIRLLNIPIQYYHPRLEVESVKKIKTYLKEVG